MIKNLSNQKGIWIRSTPQYGVQYETFLNENPGQTISFIPFENPYGSDYLGSVGFLDVKKFERSFFKRNNIDVREGLVQNHFYPLGNPWGRRSLRGKGLARKIEAAVAKDLLTRFPEDTNIIIAASSDSHLAYCRRIGLTPLKVISLEQYNAILEMSRTEACI